MKTEESDENEGGVKKIIYNGSTKKRSLFDDDDSYNQQWNFKSQQQNNAKSGQFNLDDVWSIKKNVGVNKSPVANPAGGSFWERGAGKGYYSRHGGLSDEESAAPVTSTQGGGYYPQSKNYSYSYGNSSADKLQAPSAGGSTNTSPRGGNNSLRGGAPNSMNNGLTNGSTMSNGHSHNMGPSMGSSGMGSMGQGRHGGPVSSRYQGPVSSNPRKF